MKGFEYLQATSNSIIVIYILPYITINKKLKIESRHSENEKNKFFIKNLIEYYLECKKMPVIQESQI